MMVVGDVNTRTVFAESVTEPMISGLFQSFCLHIRLDHESDVADTASSSFLELLVVRADGFDEGLRDQKRRRL